MRRIDILGIEESVKCGSICTHGLAEIGSQIIDALDRDIALGFLILPETLLDLRYYVTFGIYQGIIVLIGLGNSSGDERSEFSTAHH